MQNNQAGLQDKSFRCPWNMGKIGGFNLGAVVESMAVLFYSSKKCNFCFIDWSQNPDKVSLLITVSTKKKHFMSQLGNIFPVFWVLPCQYQSDIVDTVSKSAAAADRFVFLIHPVGKIKLKIPSVMLHAVSCTYKIHVSFQSVSLVWPSFTFLCLQHSEWRRPLLSLPVSVA